MAKKLFVGNLAWGASDEDLQNAFSEFGAIEEAVVLKDKFSGRSKGFGFVTFTEDADADNAISAMNGKSFMDRDLTVNEARPRE